MQHEQHHLWHPLQTIQTVAAFCGTHGVAAWLVGGTARDLALGRAPHDIDIAVAGDGLALARELADMLGGAFVALDDERGTGRVVCPPASAPASPASPRLTIDMVQLRAPTIDEDLRLRDFTLNALALPLVQPDEPAAAREARLRRALDPATPPRAADLLDPCGGLPDLESRTLRPCSPTSLHDDPLRTLRAMRLGAALDLRFADELHASLRAAAPQIGQVAAERVRDELLRLLALPIAAPWLRRMDDCGLLTSIFPELEAGRDCEQPIIHFLPVLGHMLETVACLEWLLHPLIGQPAAPPSPPAAVQAHPDLPRDLPYAERYAALLGDTLSGGHPRLALFKLATLLHDNAKPQTRQPKPDGGVTFYSHQTIGADVARNRARQLRLSRQARGYIALIVREHMRPGQLRGTPNVTPRALVRFLRDTEDAGPDLLLHAMADHLAVRGPNLDQADWQHHVGWTADMLERYWGQPPTARAPLLNGHELMHALRLAPGKLVGELLRDIHEAQAAGEISTSEQALAMARRRLSERR